MRKILMMLWVLLILPVPAAAARIEAPAVPEAGLQAMPQRTDSFGEGLKELLQKTIGLLQPELQGALESCCQILVLAMVLSILPLLSDKLRDAAGLAGAVTMGTVLLGRTGTLIRHAADAVVEICTYGKLLCPVMTTALAAQGGITTSAALYTATMALITVMGMLVSRWMVPMVYGFLLCSVAHCAIGEGILKQFADFMKRFLTWLLKTVLILFTTYMSITGVISGTTDAAALKAAKVAISSVVPVVGGILSDASESVLVSMEVMKNAAGIYGILAVLAISLGPFLKVGLQYLLLKAAAALCSVFGNKGITELLENFSSAMGLLLAMVAVGCMLILISTVCFLKGIG